MAIDVEKEYSVRIKAKYEIEKGGEYSDNLINPSPVQLKNLCLLLNDKGLSKKDKVIFETFFRPKEENKLADAINNFQNNKFKTIQQFLTSTNPNRKTNIRNLNLIAVLINFEPRPYKNFHNNPDIVSSNLNDSIIHTIPVNENEITKPNTLFSQPLTSTAVHSKTTRPLMSRKNSVLFFSLFFLISSVIIYYSFIKHKPYLQWDGDIYAQVNDDEYVNDSSIEKVPYNESLLDFKRVQPTDTTTYFEKDGKAKIWYCKDDSGKLELFNGPGLGYHPESNKSLRKITSYMIYKYLYRKDTAKK